MNAFLKLLFILPFFGCSDGFEITEKWESGTPKIKILTTESGIFQKQFYQNGNLKSDGFLIDGEKNGLWTEYYENGRKESEITYVFGRKVGEIALFHSNGKKKAFGEVNQAGNREGIWHFWYDNGQLEKSGEFDSGELTGDWNYYDKKGNLDSEAIFGGSGKIMMLIEYYDSNALKKEYYRNGFLKYSGNSKAGLKEGKCLYYFENGQISYSGEYSRGKRVGLWIFWKRNGAGLAAVQFSDGIPEKVRIENLRNDFISNLPLYLYGDNVFYFEEKSLRRKGNRKTGFVVNKIGADSLSRHKVEFLMRK